MLPQTRLSKLSFPCLLAALVWLVQAGRSMLSGTISGLVFGAILASVGAIYLGVGVSQLAWPGDRRINQTGALASAIGVLLAIPSLAFCGFAPALGLAASALFAGWGAGRVALALEPHTEGTPVPNASARLAAQVAVDDLILGFEQFQSTGFALDGTIERVIDEIDRLDERFAASGIAEKPEAYHVHPPELTDPEIERREIANRPVEILRFESGYAPAEGEPGRERWLGYDACRDGWAYVLRHPGGPRPWLVATNGFRMGHAAIDVRIFSRFHAAGANVVMPVLPLHGPRRLGLHSGSGFLGVDVVDTLHAEAQAVWDMRRLLSWVRGQNGGGDVGAFGLSLGGFTTAVFASLAEDLRCAILGIPVADLPRILERHGSPHQMRYAQSLGYDYERIARVLRPISPLALTPRVPHAGRLLFAATADRLVPPDQVRDLWRHWAEPELVWYEGTHVSFRNERRVWDGVDRMLLESGVVPRA